MKKISRVRQVAMVQGLSASNAVAYAIAAKSDLQSHKFKARMVRCLEREKKKIREYFADMRNAAYERKNVAGESSYELVYAAQTLTDFRLERIAYAGRKLP